MIYNKYNIPLLIITILLVVSVITGTSYSLWIVEKSQTNTNVIESGCFSISVVENSNFSLTNAYPISDASGLKNTPYSVTVENTCSINSLLDLRVNVLSTSTMNANAVKIAYSRDSGNTSNPVLLGGLNDIKARAYPDDNTYSNVYELITGEELKPGESRTYNVYMWMDINAGNENMGQALNAKISIVTSATYLLDKYEDESGASSPELYSGLIPVTYNDSNDIVVADITSKWYNYDNHNWANAILIDQSNLTTKAKYLNADGSFKSGTPVDISDVLQMYVWIPRYKYKLFNVEGAITTAQMIEVEFESSGTAKSTGSSNGEWLTHPAFTFGTTELDGIWVGKFESSGTSVNYDSISEITIIPNVSSMRYQTIGNMFNASRAIETNAKYGLSSDEIDTHMMKNMEWGAVAYLTNSKYGRYINESTCIASGCGVWSNSTDFITGGATDISSNELITYKWNTEMGVNASTTGTIYGIYDMSGAAIEYVMGNMLNLSNDFYQANSGLSQPESKYYDSYTYGTSSSDILRSHLGDAIKEVYGWYENLFIIVNSSTPWFGRGGDYSMPPGVFNSIATSGTAEAFLTFRVVMSST